MQARPHGEPVGHRLPVGRGSHLLHVDGGAAPALRRVACHRRPAAHTISYWSVDNAGNVENAHSGYVNVDITAPVTTATGLAASASTGWTNAAKTVILSATDALSGPAATYYTVDGGGQQTYTTSFSISAVGSHAISYWSVDNAGNVETAHTGYVNIDVAAPVTNATGLSATRTSGWHTAASSFTLAASDTGGSGLATTSYTVDGGATALYAGSVIVNGDASHVITYWSTDAAGNVEVHPHGLPQHRFDSAGHHGRNRTQRLDRRSGAGDVARVRLDARASPPPPTRSAAATGRPTAAPSPSATPPRSPTGRPTRPATSRLTTR